MTTRGIFRSLFLLAAFAGCSNGGGAPHTCLPITQLVGAAGADLSISAACDAKLAGTSLLIPAGALTTTVSIGITRGEDLSMNGLTSVGPSVRFTPDGLAFAMDATLTLPYQRSEQPMGTELAIAASSVQGRSILDGKSITVDPMSDTVTTPIAHFTDYQVVAGLPAQLPDGGPHQDGGSDGPHFDGGADGPHFDGGADGPHFDGGADGPNFDGGVDALFDGGNIPDGAVDGGNKG
jgi:hypothetical protein